jgi:uncharacterized membrane protein YfcA
MPWANDLLLVAGGFVGGAVNSLAGGGTLFTFPALLAVGISPIHANATSAVALVPGALASFWGYRSQLPRERGLLVALGVPSLLGAMLGALIVLDIGERAFALAVPWLILGATGIFLLADRLHRRDHPGGEVRLAGRRLLLVMALQLGVAIYGGFFGAGMGILMLAVLGLVGLSDLNAMNGLKAFAAACINSVAAVTFLAGDCVEARPAVIMALAAIAGGYVGARGAQRIGQKAARRAVVAIGIGVALVSFYDAFQKAS